MGATNSSGRRGDDASSSSKTPATISQHGRRPSSKAWAFFIKRKDDNNNDIAVCRECHRELTAASSSGTSHLLRHPCYKEWEASRHTAMSSPPPPSPLPPPPPPSPPLSPPPAAAASAMVPVTTYDEKIWRFSANSATSRTFLSTSLETACTQVRIYIAKLTT